jgi:hypothetical protein
MAMLRVNLFDHTRARHINVGWAALAYLHAISSTTKESLPNPAPPPSSHAIVPNIGTIILPFCRCSSTAAALLPHPTVTCGCHGFTPLASAAATPSLPPLPRLPLAADTPAAAPAAAHRHACRRCVHHLVLPHTATPAAVTCTA